MTDDDHNAPEDVPEDERPAWSTPLAGPGEDPEEPDDYDEGGELAGGFLAAVVECPTCHAAVLTAGSEVRDCADHGGTPPEVSAEDAPATDEADVDAILDGPPGSLHRMGEERPSQGAADYGPPALDPTYLAQETGGEVPPTPRVEIGGPDGPVAMYDADGRRTFPSDYARAEEPWPGCDEQGHPSPDAWAQTQEQLAAEYAREPLQAVDPDDDRFAEAVYFASLVEPYGSAVPPWEYLSDGARDTYRRQAHRARELLGLIGGAGVEPQRVVVGFGSAAVVEEVLSTLRRWRDLGAPTADEIGTLIGRIEADE